MDATLRILISNWIENRVREKKKKWIQPFESLRMTKILVFIPRWWTVCVRNFATSVQRPFTRNENFFYFIYFFFFFDQSSNEFESTITRLIVAQSFETCCLCVIRGCRCTAGESSRLLQVSSLHAHFLVQTPYDAPLPLQPERDTFPVYVMCDYRSKYSSNVYKWEGSTKSCHCLNRIGSLLVRWKKRGREEG